MALQLKRLGVQRVRPLSGGLAAWIELDFPVDLAPLVQIEVRQEGG